MAAYVITYLESPIRRVPGLPQGRRPTFAPYGGKPIVVDGQFEVWRA